MEARLNRGDVESALERLALYFAGAATRQGVLARRALGCSAAGDAALAAELAAAMAAELRPDGSIGGAAVPTIWRAHELLDLDDGPDRSAAERVMLWVLGRQGQRGAYGEGCSPDRHARRACEHFLAGFFSPAPPEQRVAPVTLPDGKIYRAEAAARFAISCLALRAALRAGHEALPAVVEHLAGLTRLQELWAEWAGYFAPDAMVAGLHALAVAPAASDEPARRLAAFVAAQQGEDGTWPNADLFHVLDALLACDTPEARAAVRRAAPALVARQRADGTFGTTAQQERALIGARALRLAVG